MDMIDVQGVAQDLQEKKLEVIAKWMSQGVIFESVENVDISPDVVIGKGCVIAGDNQITGNTVIGDNVHIGRGNIINNAHIGSDVSILKSVVVDCEIGRNTTIGPFANIHTGSSIARDCRVGDFVEIKNSHIGINTKMAHLAYIGDSDIGDKCNIGCGVIFANYDGHNKHRSTLGNSVFVGSNSNIIAPVVIEDNAYIAAGTTVTCDLPAKCMCIGRQREIIKENRSKYHMSGQNKYFGTDGIRGIYGENLTEKIAYMVGNFLGYCADKGRVVVGRDTRVSGTALADAVMRGVMDTGCDVVDLGVCATPCVAYVTSAQHCGYGIMITASHNPAEYNGIKVFDNKGQKLTNTVETDIERHIDNDKPYLSEYNGSKTSGKYLVEDYLNMLTSSLDLTKDLSVVVDCANGSTSMYAQQVFERVGARVTMINSDRSGEYINHNCGALHPEVCADKVRQIGADIGFTFDGDGDRVLAVNEQGKVVDGDQLIYLFAKVLKDKGRLAGNGVVGTIMTNAGVENSLNKIGVQLVRTNVGDHFVAEKMGKCGYCVGGEQSGHIILSDYESTGDGILVALLVCDIVSKQGKLSELIDCDKYCQCNINIATQLKDKIASDKEVLQYASEMESGLKGKGRVLLRASGTEPKLRVTVECEEKDLATKAAEEIKSFIAKRYDI